MNYLNKAYERLKKKYNDLITDFSLIKSSNSIKDIDYKIRELKIRISIYKGKKEEKDYLISKVSPEQAEAMKKKLELTDQMNKESVETLNYLLNVLKTKKFDKDLSHKYISEMKHIEEETFLSLLENKRLELYHDDIYVLLELSNKFLKEEHVLDMIKKEMITKSYWETFPVTAALIASLGFELAVSRILKENDWVTNRYTIACGAAYGVKYSIFERSLVPYNSKLMSSDIKPEKADYLEKSGYFEENNDRKRFFDFLKKTRNNISPWEWIFTSFSSSDSSRNIGNNIYDLKICEIIKKKIKLDISENTFLLESDAFNSDIKLAVNPDGYEEYTLGEPIQYFASKLLDFESLNLEVERKFDLARGKSDLTIVDPDLKKELSKEKTKIEMFTEVLINHFEKIKGILQGNAESNDTNVHTITDGFGQTFTAIRKKKYLQNYRLKNLCVAIMKLTQHNETEHLIKLGYNKIIDPILTYLHILRDPKNESYLEFLDKFENTMLDFLAEREETILLFEQYVDKGLLVPKDYSIVETTKLISKKKKKEIPKIIKKDEEVVTKSKVLFSRKKKKSYSTYLKFL